MGRRKHNNGAARRWSKGNKRGHAEPTGDCAAPAAAIVASLDMNSPDPREQVGNISLRHSVV